MDASEACRGRNYENPSLADFSGGFGRRSIQQRLESKMAKNSSTSQYQMLRKTATTVTDAE